MIFMLSLIFILYFVGLINCIIITNKNLLTFLFSAEIMFLGLDLFFIWSSLVLDHYNGIIYGVSLLMLTVGESIIGLSLSIIALKMKNSTNFIDYTNLKF
jgi:NADH:ubiquinone oxidoreductase subunit K